MTVYHDLQNLNAIVTGASSGIGQAVVRLLKKNNANVLAAARRMPKQIDGNSYSFPLDLCNRNSIEECAKFGEQNLGKVDLLIQIAGYIEPAPLHETSIENWQTTMDVNVNGPFYFYQKLYPILADNGRIVNLSSLAGFCGASKFAGFGAYTASKMAISGLTEVMAAELLEKNIRANALCPGAVDTPMLKKAAPDFKAEMSAEDVAKQVLFYASESSFPTNGKTIAIAGYF